MSKDILDINNTDRVALAHSFLEPNDDGSVKLTRLYLPGGVLKSAAEIWTERDFERKLNEVRDLTNKLRALRNDLTTSIRVPNVGWMSTDSYQPPLPRASPAVLSTTTTAFVPLPPSRLIQSD
jgi:hypothetical protein